MKEGPPTNDFRMSQVKLEMLFPFGARIDT